MNIAVVEDDVLTRRRIVNQLSQSLTAPSVVEVGTCAQARELAQTRTIDCWLIDLGLPDGHGIDLIRHVRGLQPQANVLVITVFGDANNIVNSIEAGANGYLLKDALDHDLCRAVEAVNTGGTPLSPLVASMLLERFVRPFADGTSDPTQAQRGVSKPALALPMTPREIELLNLFARGYTYQEAAELMAVGVSTIQSHVRNIYSKLMVSSKSEAVFEAKAMGLLN
jgi:DNA-binding NarL/FixJ family response regulator